MLLLPLFTSIFFIMCTQKAPTPEAAPGATTASSSSTAVSSIAAIETTKLDRIEIHTEKVNGAVHWMPAKITVKAGKDYLLVAKHQLEGGFDFHGLLMKDFDIQAQVNRNKDFTTVISIPADKKGKFVIGCHFHPAHKSAELIVE